MLNRSLFYTLTVVEQNILTELTRVKLGLQDVQFFDLLMNCAFQNKHGRSAWLCQGERESDNR